MIKGKFTPHLNPNKSIEVDCPFDHLCLWNGKEALACLEIMELKGFFSYSGSFVIEGSDLLDATNVKRDRTAASVIVASESACVVTRSQIPFGLSPKTEKIDSYIKRYIDQKGVPTAWQSSFSLAVSSAYTELCARPLYVVMDLSKAEKGFAIMTIDLLHKALSSYRIYIYAPQLFPYPLSDVTFYDDVPSILFPAAPKPKQKPKPEASDREKALAYFFADLKGTSSDDSFLPRKRKKDKSK